MTVRTTQAPDKVQWWHTTKPRCLRDEGTGVRVFGVADGTRTRDTQDHNLVLYQLNYSHHRCVKATRYRLTHAA